MATSALEWMAFIFAVIQVVLAWQNKTLNFYAGIISVSLYTWLLYDGKLYAESLLNIYYFIISVAGILLWNKRDRKVLPVSHTSSKEWVKATALFVILFAILYYVLKMHTDSTVPLPDALVTALAWAGAWLMIHRKVENWLVLNISNIIAIPLLWHKGFALTALLSLIYFVIAIAGYFRWKKMAEENS